MSAKNPISEVARNGYTPILRRYRRRYDADIGVNYGTPVSCHLRYRVFRRYRRRYDADIAKQYQNIPTSAPFFNDIVPDM